MCINVVIRRDDKQIVCENFGELHAALGFVPFLEGDEMSIENDCCLCPVDMEKTAAFACMNLFEPGSIDDDWCAFYFVEKI